MKHALLMVGLWFAGLMGMVSSHGQQPLQRVGEQLHVVTENERTTLNRATGELVSTVDVRIYNLGGREIVGPLHVVARTTGDDVRVTGALGGTDDPLYGAYYIDATPQLTGNRLLNGEQVSFSLTFIRPRTTEMTYELEPRGNLPEVLPPQITVLPFAPTVAERQTLTIHVQGTDPEGGVVVLAGSPSISNATFAATSGVAAAGTFQFIPANGQAGVYTLTFVARNPQGLTAQETVTFTVVREGRAPLIEDMPPRTMRVGDALITTVPVLHPDGAPVTLTADPLPSSAILASETKTFLFTPTATETGVYSIGFTATDGVMTSPTQHLAITVLPLLSDGVEETNQFTLVVDPVQSPTLTARQRITGFVNVGDPPEPRPMATSALITGLNPATVKIGDELDLILTGQAAGLFQTHFNNEASQVVLGPGINVQQVTVQSPHQLTARVKVQPSAQLGPRSVTVVTSNETAISIIALNVGAGTIAITGTLIDSITTNGVGSAMVTVQGTGFTTTTHPDGSFSLTGVPPGEYTLIVNGPNHQLLRFKINTALGVQTDLGVIPTAPTVFDPNAPASVSLLSVLGRGLGSFTPQDAEKAREALRDALLLCGGIEAGLLDEYGNQLNPSLASDGIMSLTAEGMDSLVERIMRAESYSLAEILLPFSFGFEWGSTPRFTLAEWLDALQVGVNAAWADPTNPNSALPILIFNQRPTLAFDPPVLSPATRLNQAQTFLFVASMFSYMVDPDGTYAAGGPPVAPSTIMARGWTERLSDWIVASAHADDPPEGGGRTWTSYWRAVGDYRQGFMEFQYNVAFTAFNQMSMVMARAGMTGRAGALLVTLPVVGLLETQVAGAFLAIEQAARVPEPPRMIAATVVDGANDNPVVFVRFRRSPSDTLSGGARDPRLVYTLYRFRNFNQPRDLIQVRAFPGNDSELMLMDLNPLPGASFYAVTVTRLSSLEDDVDTSELSAATPWWNAPLTGMNNPLINMLRSARRSMSDYSEPGLVNVGASPGLFQISGLVVGADGTVYQSDVSGGVDDKKIVKIPNLGEGTPSVFAFTRFANPGHQGLAIDSHGALYSRNQASDGQFGGRVFRFAQPNGAREHVGSINYFSQQLMFANPVMGGPMAMGPGANPVFSPEDVYVVDTLAKQIKRIPVQSTQPALRRVGQPYAAYPFQQQVIGIKVGGPSNRVYALASAVGSILDEADILLEVTDFAGTWLDDEVKAVPGSLARVHEPEKLNQPLQIRMQFDASAQSEALELFLEKILPDDSPATIRIVSDDGVLMDESQVKVPIAHADLDKAFTVEAVHGGVADFALRAYYKGDLLKEDRIRISAIPGVDPKPGRLIFVNPGTVLSSAPYDDFVVKAASTLGEALAIAQENDNILIARDFTNVSPSTLSIPANNMLIAGLTGRFDPPPTPTERGARQSFDWSSPLPVLRSESGRMLHVDHKSGVHLAGLFFINGRDEYGAAIRIDEGPETRISVSRFIDNDAVFDGGAIYAQNLFPGTTNYIEQCWFGSTEELLYNRANRGAALAGYMSHFMVRDTVFEGHRATQGGGAVYLEAGPLGTLRDDKPMFERCSFIDNASTANDWDQGGGAVFMRDAEGRFVSCLFRNNLGQNGGAIAGMGTESIVGPSALSVIESCDFVANTGSRVGGAVAAYGLGENAMSFDYILLSGYEFNIANSRFHTNRSFNAHGGAVFATSIGTTVRISDSEFIGNRTQLISPESDGGAIAAGSFAKTEITRTLFESNWSGDGGGAIYHTTRGSSIMHECEFYDNEGSKGGAIEGSEWANFTITDTIIGEPGRGNRARATGGGLYLRSGSLVLSGSNGSTRVAGNTAISRGGGLYMSKHNTDFAALDYTTALSVEINGVEITDNQAHAGGAMYIMVAHENVWQNTFTIENSVIARNTVNDQFHNLPRTMPVTRSAGIVFRQSERELQDASTFVLRNSRVEDHYGAGLVFGLVPVYVSVGETTILVEDVEFARNDVGIHWHRTAAPATIRNSVFHSNTNGPVRVDLFSDEGANISVENVQFHVPGNPSSTGAAWFYQPQWTTIENSDFNGFREQDGRFGLRTDAAITATNNYWGAAAGPHYPPHNDNPDGAFIDGPGVTYAPFKNTP